MAPSSEPDRASGRPAPQPGPATVLVMSLSRSGSTLLDLILGTHPNIVGLGEIANFFRKWLTHVIDGADWRCSCGDTAVDCPFWGPVIDGLTDRGDDVSVADGYGAVIRRFRAAYPPDTVLLDSSKKLESLDGLRAEPGATVSVIVLVRDVRGWIASFRDRGALRRPSLAAEIGARGFRRALGQGIADTPAGLAWRWKTGNQRILDALDRGDDPYLVVSYEQLCFHPDSTLAGIVEWLGLPPVDGLVYPAESNGHVIAGNDLRIDDEGRRRISYDTRWLTRGDWIVPYRVVPGVRRMNEQLVWSGWG